MAAASQTDVLESADSLVGSDDALQQRFRLQADKSKTVRKKLVRRTDRDISQQLRLGAQLGFLALNLWVGIQFYLWVRWAESGGRLAEVSRPAGVEGWLPIEGLMQSKYFLLTGTVPRIHAAGFFLFLTFLLIS